MIGAIVLEAVLGLVLLGIGRWGRENRGSLASGWMDPEDRAGRERVYRRGAITCSLLGGVFLAAALLGTMSAILRG